MRARRFPTLPRPLPRAATAGRAALLWALPGCILVEKGTFDSGAPPSSVESSPTTDPAPVDAPPDPEDGGAGGAEVRPAPLSLRFIDGALQLSSTPAQPGGLVGLAETRGPCVSAGACWTGEDCRTPFVGADGVERPPLCRGLGPDGRLTLEAGVDLAAVDADSTLFRPSSADDMSWSLTAADGSCVAGGADPAHFSGCAPFVP
jgi:hypothetical protein